MAAGYEFTFCDSPFWDINETWYSPEPQISDCFRSTALVWTPGCVLIIAIICEYFNLNKAKCPPLIPWNCFNRFRFALTLVLVTFKASETAVVLYGQLNQEAQPVLLDATAITAPFIQAICYAILALVYHKQRKAGLHTSAPIWFYLFTALVCDTIDFYNSVYWHPERVVELVHFPLLLLLFILECRGDTPILSPPDPRDPRPDSPEKQASFCSSLTFWWFNDFLFFGYRCRLKMSDLWKTLVRDQATQIVPIFRRAWAKTRNSSKNTYHAASGHQQGFNGVGRVLCRLFWLPLLVSAFLKLLQDSLQFVTPMILKKLLAFMKSNDEPNWHGTVFAGLLLVIPTIQSIILGTYFYNMQVVGLQVRTMLIGAVYRKALLLSGSSRMDSTSGEIVNLMAVDSQRFQDLLIYVNLLWSAPFQIILAIYLLYNELGWSVFAGVGCMALVLPANAYLASRIKYSQVKLMKTKDERIKQMNEVLSGIKVIKLYAWENSFMANLFKFRNRELNYLKRILTLDALQTFLWQCSPFVVALVTFAVYVNVDPKNVLDAEKAFVSISLFNLLRFPLTMLPSLVTTFVLTVVSAKRLSKFLNSNELVEYVSRNEELEAISIEGGTLAWSHTDAEGSEVNPILNDIDLHVKPNSFVAIVGQVASGKSSLLSGILGEMHRISGRFNVCKSLTMAYVPQQAWIQNLTVKDNILFGQQFDESRYKKVLSDCSLYADLECLPGGDKAEIGEKGINLSGGQKQRVSLARACYSDSDIYLLDDPLSALDSHVAKRVFDRVLSSSSGLLKNKTRLLATNSLFVLPHVDHIIMLDNGRVIESGSYKDLMKIEGGHLAESMRQYSGTQGEAILAPIQAPVLEQLSPETESEDKVAKSAAPAADIGKLTEVEKLETGSVGYSVYVSYFKALSLIWLAVVSLSLVSSAGFNVATNLWLSVWSSDSEDPNSANDSSKRTLRLIVYAVLGGLQCLTVLSGAIGLSRGAVRAARRMHSSLLNRVMHSPMTFFDTTPIGRVVNRFAKDIDVVDSTLPGTFRSWLNCLLQVISTMFVIVYSFPTFLLIVVPLGVIYYLIQKVFIVSKRQLKRLESITRSPIYSHFSETLSGISTIRAYNCVDRFVSHSNELMDLHQSCSYPNIIANRWLSVRLEFFGNLITASAALFSIYYKGVIGAGVTGLTISYSLSITQTLSWLVRMSSDLETNIVSVERILEYMINKQEDLWVKDVRPPSEWPDKGGIRIEGYSTKYRDDTDLVLRNMTIDIKPREKIGIVGRTGSGKSSLSLSLFRILEPTSGKILIDGLNVVDYGLHDIRSKLTIIPQDPVLFSGTLRFNLDPLKQYTDMEIWRALELSHLKSYIGSLKMGLDHHVSEYGENFSVGQRQLICLTRAILGKSRILILDEATASVDLETDNIVQKTIRTIFHDCTIITIAHRLHTILDSDRILVLDRGCVKELDSPANLAANPTSAFSTLVRDAGIETSNILKLAEKRREEIQL